MLNKLDTFINKDVDTKQSQYITFKQKELTGLLVKKVFKVVIYEQFFTPTKPSSLRKFRAVHKSSTPTT